MHSYSLFSLHFHSLTKLITSLFNYPSILFQKLKKMSPNKRKTLLNSLLSSHLACSCGPSRPSHHDVFQPRPRPKPKSSSSSSNDGEIPITLSSPASAEDMFDENKPSPAMLSPKSTNGKPGSGPGPEPVPSGDVLSLQGSVMVVVTDSEDPYKDFRDSMLQMINENKIFSKEDLHHLLRCFLRLNSPTHHHYILHAFFQVCDAVVSSSNTSNTH